VRIVRVEQHATAADLPEYGEEHSGVEAEAPRGLVHPNALVLEPEPELGAGTGHHDLVGEPSALQLPG
jgi:hypothetical protein